jgi:hypothetical protein
MPADSPLFGESDPSTLLAFYDLAHYPVSFDFVAFLMAAELARLSLNRQSLHVVIIPGEKADGLSKTIAEAPYWEACIDWRKRAILEGCLPLFPAVTGWTVLTSREEGLAWQAAAALSFPRRLGPKSRWVSLVDIYNQLLKNLPDGMSGDSLRAPEDALACIDQWMDAKAQGRRLVTITLRDRPFAPGRNSAVEEWANFARRLDPKTYLPVFVPDTDMAASPPAPLKEWVHMPEASFNVSLRLALYERSWLNLWVLHGPAILCWLSRRCRYLGFRIVPSGLQGAELERHLGALDAYGFASGGTPRFAAPGQRWIWADDEEETIWREFERMRRELDSAQ